MIRRNCPSYFYLRPTLPYLGRAILGQGEAVEPLRYSLRRVATICVAYWATAG